MELRDVSLNYCALNLFVNENESEICVLGVKA